MTLARRTTTTWSAGAAGRSRTWTSRFRYRVRSPRRVSADSCPTAPRSWSAACARAAGPADRSDSPHPGYEPVRARHIRAIGLSQLTDQDLLLVTEAECDRDERRQ